MKTVAKLTAKKLREHVYYNPTTGYFYRQWKTKDTLTRIGGKKHHGYIVFQICGYRNYAHRFAFLFMNGTWPEEVDHINGVRDDNRWANLRKASRFLNNGNRKKTRGTLPKGVCKVKRRDGGFYYYGRITINGKQLSCGRLHRSPKRAHEDYMEYAQNYYGEFARAE